MSGKEPRFNGEVSEKSHKNMSRIRGKDTSIEVALRKALWAKGYRFRKNYKSLPGRPDIVLTKYRIAIFCDSEFFHGKDWPAQKAKLEKGKNPDYWVKKIERNIERDKEKDAQLKADGWRVLHFWGKDILKNPAACIETIEEAIYESKGGAIVANNKDMSDYDKTDPLSIEAYSQKLIGKTFREICGEDENSMPARAAEEAAAYGVSTVSETKRNKGNLGQIIEEQFFHYSCNSDSNADFAEAGVELKVTPYKKKKNGSLVAKERLILTMIDYFTVVDESFEESHLWKKSRLILLIYYLYLKEIKDNLDYRIDYSKLFTPPEQDLKIIKHDFETIVSKIRAGKAHELSEGDTLYLSAATKAATSQDRREQPFSDVPAKPRAFAFKNSYMTHVLNNYIVPGKKTYEPIISTDTVDSFESYVVERINANRGKSVEELCQVFNLDTKKNPKHLTALLAYRMLGIKGNHAEEFEKANVVVKTIRIGKNGRIKENMSFPIFKFKELVEENWENSTFGNYLRETRFLFVVYKFDKDGTLCLRGCQFWNIPYDDLENDVKLVWERAKTAIVEGLQIEIDNGDYQSNFPKAKENRVCLVKSHGRNNKDMDVLPDGRSFPKQCFWLKNTYIYGQLDDELKA